MGKFLAAIFIGAAPSRRAQTPKRTIDR
jgi:hypothetical protein